MERRVVLAILLMMAIAIAPSLLFKPPPVDPMVADSLVTRPPAGPPQAPPAAPSNVVTTPRPIDKDSVATPAVVVAEDTIRVTSPLFTYAFSTRGGRLVEATMKSYVSMVPVERAREQPVQILRPDGDFLSLTLVSGRDTLSLRDWTFTPSESAVAVSGGPQTLTMVSERGGVRVAVTYRFLPTSYHVGVSAEITGLGPNGGVLLVGLGPGLRNTESDSLEHLNILGVVTKAGDTRATAFRSLTVGEVRTLSGPFDWVAVKSKYFVASLFAFDSTSQAPGRIGGVLLRATDSLRRRPGAADVVATLPVPSTGGVEFSLYAGPMEYSRLKAMGRDFDDVNPYGWAFLRTLIRPVAVAARWLLVWMHRTLSLPYGVILILFGVMIRVLLWPLNQKAMRSSMAFQAIQPLQKEIQEKYKGDPQRAQQEMFKLFKEHNVNPMGGCWPMLVPMPVLFALFFVFQNTIELRGAPFLWLTDLSRADPLYIIPVLMGLSMFVVSKIGQLGMPPNPQTKMMLYIMPGMMTVLFLRFASGLNLYYAVQNLASIPQQWMLAKERMKRLPPPAPAKPPPGSAGPKPRRR